MAEPRVSRLRWRHAVVVVVVAILGMTAPVLATSVSPAPVAPSGASGPGAETHLSDASSASVGADIVAQANETSISEGKPPDGLTSGVASLLEGRRTQAVGQDGTAEPVTVRINAEPGRASEALALARSNGATVQARAAGRVVVEVPPRAIESLRTAPPIRSIQLPVRPEQTGGPILSEGVAVVGADDLHAKGYTGDGVTVGVVDIEGNFNASNPEIDDNVVGVTDVTSGQSFTNATGAGGHGSAVAETVVDVAPNASLELVEVQTEVEMHNAVQHLQDNTSADVIVMSLGVSTGPFDGSGFIGDQIGDARTDGVPMFVSAGNAGGGKHLNLTWSDPDGNDFLNFTGSDETLGVSTQASYIRITVSWNDYPTSSEDYDIGLVDSGGNFVATSTDTQAGGNPPEERITFTNLGQCPCSLKIQNWNANGTADFEIFANDGTSFEYNTSARSVTRPATDEAAVTVGAIHWDTLQLEPYSSEGPTIDGRRKPEFSAPAATTSSVYPSFSGTSSSAPHAAGVAALLMGFNESITPSTLESVLKDTADQTDPQYSSPDPNNQTGHGLLNASAAFEQHRTLLEEQWRTETGPGHQFASPAVGPNRVIIGGLNQSVYAVDRDSGSVGWDFVRDGQLADASATIENDRAYVGSGGGVLYAINRSTGSAEWSTQLQSAVDSTPAVNGTSVFFGVNNGTVLSLDTAGGAVQWTYDGGEAVYSTVDVANGTVFVSLDNGTLLALDESTGALEWTFDSSTETGHSSPVYDDGTVYFAADQVYAIDASSGSVNWQSSYGGTAGSTPAIDGGRVYVGSDDGIVYTFDASGGSTIWTYDAGSSVAASPAVSNNRVVAASSDGTVHLLDDSGTVEKTVDVGSGIYSSPAIVDGVVYVGTDSGELVALAHIL